MTASTRVVFLPLAALAASIVVGAQVAGGHQEVALALAGAALIAGLGWRYPQFLGVAAVGVLLIPYTWSRGNPGVYVLVPPGAIAAVAVLLTRVKLRANAIDYLLVAFFVSIALSGAFSGRGLDWGANSYARDEIEGLLIPYFAFRLIIAAWPQVAAKVPSAFIAVGGLLSILAIWEELQNRGIFAASGLTNPQDAQFAVTYYRQGAVRATATMGQPLALGAALIIPLLLAFACRRWRMFALIAVGEVATLSRGPYVGALVALGAFCLLTGRIRRIWLLVSIIAVAGVFIGPVNKMIGASFETGTSEQVNAHYRSSIVNATLHSLTVWGHPLPKPSEIAELYGRPLQPTVHSAPTDPASEPVLLATEQGAVGLLVWVGFLLAFACAIRVARSAKDLLLLTLGTALLAEWLVLLTVPLITNFQYAFALTLALTAARLDTVHRRHEGSERQRLVTAQAIGQFE
jgi:hypothetical protein